VTSYTQQSIPGSRADAEPTDRLPTLVPGRDRLPTRCPRPTCGSAFLGREEPLGLHQRGMLWCQICSRSLCWLAAPLAAVPSRSAASITSDAGARVAPVVAPPATAELVTVRRRIIAADFERRPGCGRSCTPAYGHDPLTHEQHGADAVYADLRARRAGDVATGRLLVQLGPAGVYVDGAEIALAPYDWEVLAYLAEHLGDLCTLGEITASVWGQAYYDNWKWKRWQPVRNNIMRIKQALGPAAPLIENEPGRGYRLADAPPC
jgi:hypothetical protein